jgi:23S rRNA (pseudouridine1915-N3)-methyltransferase
MRIVIASVGRDRKDLARALCEDYARRCAWPVELIELAPRATSLPAGRRLEEEAERLLKALPEGAIVIALDERGRNLDSRGFARRLADWRDTGRPAVAFVIGGADGLAPALLERADERVAFGRMTWPHRLVRVMLLEQIYRAQTILAGHPYHRD